MIELTNTTDDTETAGVGNGGSEAGASSDVHSPALLVGHPQEPGGRCVPSGGDHPPASAYSRENDGVLDAEELGDGSLERSSHGDGAMGMPDGGMSEVEMRRCLYGGWCGVLVGQVLEAGKGRCRCVAWLRARLRPALAA